MKRVAVVGKDLEKVGGVKARLDEMGFEVVKERPDLVIGHGGDGMFLIAERVYPGVPKILVRDSDVGNMASDLDVCDILDLYLKGSYEMEEILKLRAVYRGRFESRELVGVNDIVIRNSLPTEALRFRYRVGGSDWSGIVIGDGVVVSTSYGSNKGAYFHSIVGRSFLSGIGVAFNNSTEKIEPIFLGVDGRIEVEVVRGVGVLVADNNRDFINLESGDRIEIELSDLVARRVVLNRP